MGNLSVSGLRKLNMKNFNKIIMKDYIDFERIRSYICQNIFFYHIVPTKEVIENIIVQIRKELYSQFNHELNYERTFRKIRVVDFSRCYKHQPIGHNEK